MHDVITYINEKLVAILWSLIPVLSGWCNWAGWQGPF